MTTSPVPSITDELLAELEQKAKAAGGASWICIDGDGIDTDHRLITTDARIAGPTVQIATVHYGNPDAGMLEPFQSEQVAAGEHMASANPATILALVEHIRSLTERLENADKDAERYAWLREKHNDNDADYAVMKFSKRANEWLHLDWKLDAAVDAEMEVGK